MIVCFDITSPQTFLFKLLNRSETKQLHVASQTQWKCCLWVRLMNGVRYTPLLLHSCWTTAWPLTYDVLQGPIRKSSDTMTGGMRGPDNATNFMLNYTKKTILNFLVFINWLYLGCLCCLSETSWLVWTNARIFKSSVFPPPGASLSFLPNFLRGLLRKFCLSLAVFTSLAQHGMFGKISNALEKLWDSWAVSSSEWNVSD